MSRRVVALLCLGLAFAPARAAEPKPLWEIETATDATRPSEVPWVDYAADGRTLVAHVEGVTRDTQVGRLVAWDATSRKELFAVDLGAGLAPRSGLNAITRKGTALVARNRAFEVRLSDGKFALARPGTGPTPDRDATSGGWLDADSGESRWLVGREGEHGWDYSFMEGTMPALDPPPNVLLPEEPWHPVGFEPPTAGRFDGALALSPNGKRVAAGLRGFRAGAEFGLSLHLLMPGGDAPYRLAAAVPSGHPQNGRISAIKFGPDGKTLATGSGEGSVCVWDLIDIGSDWKPRATVRVGRFTVNCLAFSPDGKTLAAGTLDRGRASKTGTDNLWVIDVATGKPLASHRLHDAVSAVAFSPDGRTLVTGHNRGRVQGWGVDALLKAK